MAKKNYRKVIDEQFVVPYSEGSGIIKFEAWEHQDMIVKYNMAYINRNIFPNDNGRVVGYDNSHDFITNITLERSQRLMIFLIQLMRQQNKLIIMKK